MKSSWQTDTGTLACRWSEVGQRVQCNSAWCKKLQTFKVVICRPFRILRATVHLGEPLGSNLIALTATLNRSRNSSHPPP
jgi:hypothetical protein